MHFEPCHLLLLGEENPNRPLSFHGIRCIEEEIQKDLPNANRVGHDRGDLPLHYDLHLPIAFLDAHQGFGFASGRSQLHDRRRSGPRSTKVEQIANASTDAAQFAVDALEEIGFEGYAIGGLAVGEGQEAMFETLEFTTPMMRADRPRYLMGVGKPSDLVGGVARGVDMFDCVMPTRSGRTGQAFTRHGPINIRNAKFAEDQAPLDPTCPCPVCATWSRAYIHHLVKAGEMLGAMLMTEHNIWFYQQMMADLRAAIAEGRLTAFADDFRARYAAKETSGQ